MGLFRRIGALIRGFFRKLVGGMEDSNPDLLFEDIRGQIEKARKEAEHQIVEIQTSAELIKIEMGTSDRNLNLIRSRIDAAQKQGDKELLVELLMQEEEYQSNYETHKATYDTATAEVNKIRADYKIFESEMNSRLNELKTLKSQSKMATLRENINSLNAKYTAKSNKVGEVTESMDRARELVNRKTARANAVESLNDTNTELKLKRLDMNSARERAKLRAEAMLTGDGEGFEVKEKISKPADN
ncbi:MAG: PspA/IM30 family protein [Eubacteriales bacterium]|nr:PspA/IM30 family protein [Eubacteriales bacterium]